MFCDLALEIGKLFTCQRTDLAQCFEVLLGTLQVAFHEIGFADVFVRAAVSWVERKSLPVVLEREIELAGFAIGEAQVVLDIGVIRVAPRGQGQRLDRAIWS